MSGKGAFLNLVLGQQFLFPLILLVRLDANKQLQDRKFGHNTLVALVIFVEKGPKENWNSPTFGDPIAGFYQVIY